MTGSDWNPESYHRFADLRLQPGLDLLTRVPTLPTGDIVDLGCGSGALAPALKSRYADRCLTGVDISPAMLKEAAARELYDRLEEHDAANWRPHGPVSLIFSNAALHWLPDHDELMPKLARDLCPGGTLAVQMPHQNRAPSHRLWHDLVEQMFPGRFDPETSPGILEPADYHRILFGLGQLVLWETEYFQLLPPAEAGHPVRHFTSSTFARPVLGVLDEREREELCARYDRAMERAYPLAEDGSVLFPFRRLFFTLNIP